jgi:uncharacterized protein YprB with RNaseH-like and TPR domain
MPMAVFFDIETTGLNPHDSLVTLIGIKSEGRIQLWKTWESQGEKATILSAISRVSMVRDTIVGFNNLKFDIPFVLKRLENFGHSSAELWPLYSKKWFDLYQYLGDDFRSQKYWLEKAGIKEECPELDGKDMPACYKNKEYEKIERHLVSDLNVSEALFAYLKQKNPEYLRFS